jgi:hypothetical protein
VEHHSWLYLLLICFSYGEKIFFVSHSYSKA